MKNLLTLAIVGAWSMPVLAAAAELVAKLRTGGVGVRGPIPMPANVTVKGADLKTWVAFILTLK